MALIDVTRDFPPQIPNITNSPFPFDYARYRLATSARNSGKGGYVAQMKQDAVLFQNMPHCDSEGRPGKLDHSEHGLYLMEARGIAQDHGNNAGLVSRISHCVAGYFSL